jgi:cobalt-zinc-cadmium efflux system membrane fusion protein
MKTNFTEKQVFSIAGILLVGALLAALILLADRPTPPDDEHGRAAAPITAKHEKGKTVDEHGHADEHAEKAKPGDEHGDEKHDEAEGSDKLAKGGQGHESEEKQAQLTLDDAQVQAAGIGVQAAGPAKINTGITLPGEIRFNEDRTAHVVPRLAGVVESVRVDLGQQVKKGQVLAVVASGALSEHRSELLTAQKRLTLARTTFEREKKLWEEKISAQQDYLEARQGMEEAEIAVRNVQQKLKALGVTAQGTGDLASYQVRAPFDGMVMEKRITLGESVKEDAHIFTIADLSTVWADVAVPATALNVVRVGSDVVVKATAFDATAAGKIAYVGSLLGEQTRTAKARVALPNPDRAWRPGLVVNVEILTNRTDATLAVPADAVHTVNDKSTVFLRVPGGFVPQEVTLGRSDGKLVEVTKGLAAGSQVAGTNSFVLKSELGKSSAEHSH